jgi:predicted MFS family arabinose efflux permease
MLLNQTLDKLESSQYTGINWHPALAAGDAVSASTERHVSRKLRLINQKCADVAQDLVHGLAASRRLGTFLILGGIVLLQTAAEGPIRAFFNVYLDRGLDVPPAQIGVIIGLAQLLPVAGALLTVNLLARWGAARTLAMGSIGTTVALLPLAGIPVWSMAALGFMGVMTMAAVHGPARNVFSQELVAPRWRTATAAILTIGTASGWASTAVAGGFVISAVGFAGLFALSGGLAASAAVLAWATHLLRVGRSARTPAVASGPAA